MPQLKNVHRLATLLAVGLVGLLGCAPPKAPAPIPQMPPKQACPAPSAGPNLRVTYAAGESNSPDILWDGNYFRIAWWDLREREPMVYLSRITETAHRIGGELKVFNNALAKSPDIAFDGRNLEIVWQEREKLYLLSLGDRPYPAVLLSPSGAMVSAGGWDAAVWVEKGAMLFRSGGQNAGSKPVVVAMGEIENPQLLWTGTEYAVVWSNAVAGGRDILLQRLDSRGGRRGPVVKVSGLRGQASHPVAVWNGKEYGVAWTHAAPLEENRKQRFQLFFARVPALGTMPESTRSLDFFGSADQVSLATSGEEYAVSWVGADQAGTSIYFHRLSDRGEPVGETIQVNDGAAQVVGSPTLAWNGRGYGVTWHDDRYGGDSEIFFSFVSCGEKAPEPATPSPADAGAPASRVDASPHR